MQTYSKTCTGSRESGGAADMAYHGLKRERNGPRIEERRRRVESRRREGAKEVAATSLAEMNVKRCHS